MCSDIRFFTRYAGPQHVEYREKHPCLFVCYNRHCRIDLGSTFYLSSSYSAFMQWNLYAVLSLQKSEDRDTLAE